MAPYACRSAWSPSSLIRRARIAILRPPVNPRPQAPRGSLQGAAEESEQVRPGALGLRLVVDGVVLDAPAVAGTVIHFALEPHAALVERRFELVDRLGRHGAVLDGEPQVHFRLDLGGER